MEKKLCLTKWWSKNDHLRKILLTMKLTIFIVLLSLGSLKAEIGYSQTTRLNLNIKDLPIKDVLKKIEEKSEFFFLFNSKIVDVDRNVTIRVRNERIDEILKLLFNKTDVVYKVIDRQIILTNKTYLESLNVLASNKIRQNVVTGSVTDSVDNQPLPGVNIVIQGTTDGTITDLNGEFSIEVPDANATLIFSYIGYTSKSIALNGQTKLDIKLAEEARGLDEVIVTALGIKRNEKALGYAVQKVDGNTLSTVKGVDVTTSLTGKVAGLLIKNTTEFGLESEVFIRGEKPLLVIDGVPYANMSMRDIPQDDIEEISILKGATASALYGYRGSTGAIMITTKKGSRNKGITVSVNSSTMFNAGFLAIHEMQSTYGRTVNTSTNRYNGAAQGAWGPPMEGQDVEQWDPVSKSYQTMPFLPIGKDNFKNYLEPGYIINNNINITQQGENGSIRTSASWVKNKGQYPNSMYDKITYSLGGDIKIERFTLSTTMMYNKQNSPNLGFNNYKEYDPMYSLLIWGSPDWDVTQYKDYWIVPNEKQNSSFTSGANNPYFDRYERTHSKNRDVFNGTLALNYDFTTWLKATIRSGFDYYSDNQAITISKGSYQGAGDGRVIEGGTYLWGESMRGQYDVGVGRGYSLNNDFLLFFKKQFGGLGIDAFAGGSIYYKEDNGLEGRTIGGLNLPGFYSLANSIENARVLSVRIKQQVNSLYGRLALSWKSLLFVEGTLRNDWHSFLYSSSTLQTTHAYLYPSVATSFIASELLPKMDWLSLWKLRSSWTMSKRPPGQYAVNAVYTTTTNAWGNLTSASYPTKILSSDVRPEVHATFEVGTAINVFNNRASMDFAFYSRRVYDTPLQAPVSNASGFLYNYINTGAETTRKGVELTIGGSPVKTTDWQWDVSVNWSKYAEYYTKLDDEFSADLPWVEVGERTDHLILRDFQRDPEGNIIHNNGRPLFSAYNSRYGYADPKWIWGVSTSLRYKDFTLNIAMDGRVGGLVATMTEAYMWKSGNHPESVVPERYLDATTSTANYVGQGVYVVSGEATYDTYGNILTDTREYAPNEVAVTYQTYVNDLHKGYAWGGAASPLDIYDATFLKLRELSLTYQLPKIICSKFRAQEGSFSLVGQNVFMWAKEFKYSDPDGGYENFSDPSIRYLGFSVKLVF
ncbi:MAG: SusC/RagA family TonB-linked outer membrane protein [Bacteroidales bacterium]|nr:SusC/RagA family TonB-linked outer membrane protein [Bacteroidales bacterium]